MRTKGPCFSSKLIQMCVLWFDNWYPHDAISHYSRYTNNIALSPISLTLAEIFCTHAKSSWLWLKYNPCAKTGPHSPRERVPDVISLRRVYKHFRLMQMQNPADIMKKITRHVVSIDNEGTVIRAHWHVNRAGFARVWVMLMAP